MRYTVRDEQVLARQRRTKEYLTVQTPDAGLYRRELWKLRVWPVRLDGDLGLTDKTCRQSLDKTVILMPDQSILVFVHHRVRFANLEVISPKKTSTT